MKVTVDAIEDDVLTEEEVKSIISHWKSIFEEAGQTVNKRFRVMEDKLWKVYDDAEGTHIIKLTKEEKARWVQRAMSIWDKEKEKSEEIRIVIEAVEAVRYK